MYHSLKKTNIMKTTLTVIFLSLATFGFAQDKYFTRNGTITFFSSTPAEDIQAQNFGVTSVLDIKSGDMEFSLLMKSFEFKKALMQEHFNENYVESDKFPKASFKGKVRDISSIDFSKDGKHQVKVSGDMTLHGITKPVTSDGTIEIKDGKVHANSKLMIKPEDYGIEIPSVVRANIAKEMEVTVNTTLDPLNR